MKKMCLYILCGLVLFVTKVHANLHEFKSNFYDDVDTEYCIAAANWLDGLNENNAIKAAYYSGMMQAHLQVKEMIYPNPLYPVKRSNLENNRIKE
jgi:hypothetical protein